MKKNLRIVSAAAAALLAVAPVAASAVSTVSADVNTNIVLGGTTAPAAKGDVVLTSNVKAVTKPNVTVTDNVNGQHSYYNWDGKIAGTISAAFGGQTYTANLNQSNGQYNSTVYVWTKDAYGNWKEVKPTTNGRYELEPAGKYWVEVDNISFNFGTANANKKNLKLTSSNGVQFLTSSGYIKDSITVDTDQNGAMTNPKHLDVLLPINPVDVTNAEAVNFFEKSTNTEVPNGSLSMTANPTSHQLNVSSVLGDALAKYGVRQSGDKLNSGAHITTTVSDLTDQLTKAGIKVDPLGNFEAPASFSFNLAAKSNANDATATLPVTVSVANAVQTPAAQETTRTVKIMHISTIYDKNGKATHEPALRAYHTVSVVSDPVSLKDEKGNDAGKFYKLAGKDQYIKVGNVDGTKRTLKHNSYVYKSTGKRRGKTVLKKSSSVTTYGKSFMIAGHQMYRIGENKYVKKANF